jgi:type VI secretion system secreted protein VgrG
MASFTQANRPLAVTTPLGTDVLLLTGLTVEEAMSRPFRIRLEVLAQNSTSVAFDQLLGASITVEMELAGSTTPRQNKRYFNGICNRFAQGERDEVFTTYTMELVPQLWLATRVAQSRTFQHKSVKAILQACLTGVTANLDGVTEQPARDWCVQYRETDFNFISRLMEEEGIYYYFTHANGSHTMVLADSPSGITAVPGQATVTYREVQNQEALLQAVVTSFQKEQELRSGKYTLRDYSFEKPSSTFEASKPLQPTVQVGSVSHNLTPGTTSSWEIYDWPGEYVQRFDGVDKGGGGTQDNVGSAGATDATRTVGIRMQEEAVPALTVRGTSNAGAFDPGMSFTLKTLPNTLEQQFKADGAYVLTSVQHTAHIGGAYRTGPTSPFKYQNTFTAIPKALPYRPARVTPKPVIHGTQTATVVGLTTSPSDDIFTDKYGRVKVQFPWDRANPNSADSSCWCRVATLWSSQQWGSIWIPRVGMEVVVAFEEGDPDKPIIVGCVYNATNMPPYALPDNKTQSGIKSRSSTQGTSEEFNELRMEDKKGSEEVYFHAQKDFNRVVENNDTLKVGSSDSKYCPDGSQTISIYKDRTSTIETGDETHTVKQGKRTETIQQDDTLDIKQGNRAATIEMGNDTLTIKMGNQTTKIEMGSSSTEAMQSIELKVGQNSIKIDQMGITLAGLQIKIDAQLTAEMSSQLQTQVGSQLQTQVQGTMVQVSGNAMTQISGGITMIG